MSRQHKRHLFWQTVLIMCFMWLVLLGLSYTSASASIWTLGVGTLASSAFIVCCLPDSQSARPMVIIYAYAIAIAMGALWHFLSPFLCPYTGVCHHVVGRDWFFYIVAVCAVGMTFVSMALLDIHHPPAAGLTIVLVLEITQYDAILFIFCAALCLAFLKRCCHRYLCDV